jgi:hypothetical protein
MKIERLLCAQHNELVRFDNDPSAGFVRHHITEYVEARGKLSPLVTDWLLERILIAPRCAEVKQFDGDEVVVHHRPPSVLADFDAAVEESWFRRYWSSEFPDSSWDRMKNWVWPPIGTIYADPRTSHVDLNGCSRK